MIQLLVVDDFAIAPIGPRERNDLLELLDDRVGSKATRSTCTARSPCAAGAPAPRRGTRTSRTRRERARCAPVRGARGGAAARYEATRAAAREAAPGSVTAPGGKTEPAQLNAGRPSGRRRERHHGYTPAFPHGQHKPRVQRGEDGTSVGHDPRNRWSQSRNPRSSAPESVCPLTIVTGQSK